MFDCFYNNHHLLHPLSYSGNMVGTTVTTCSIIVITQMAIDPLSPKSVHMYIWCDMGLLTKLTRGILFPRPVCCASAKCSI